MSKTNMLYCIMKGGFLEREIFVRQVVLHLYLHNLGARFSKINKHFKKHLTNLQLHTPQNRVSGTIMHGTLNTLNTLNCVLLLQK